MSKEYIEREALLKRLNEMQYGFSCCNVGIAPALAQGVKAAIDTIVKWSAADVVEVVKCSECRFNVANMEIDPLDDTDYSGRDIVCGRFLTDGMHPDDYCSYGERKDGAD